ncbi:MAG: PaaI family thioesterase [Acidimicrobiales bacterium]
MERQASKVRADAAASVNELIHSMVGYEGSDDDLAAVAKVAAELAERLRQGPRRVRPAGQMLRYEEPVPDGGELSCWPDCMIAGQAHPQGTGLIGRRDGDEVVAQVTLGPAHEGPPGRAHGGMIASLFDEVMGFALWMDAVPAFTAWLRVEYRQPVQLETPVELRCSVTGRERRKVFLSGTALVDGEVVAEAEGLFVIPRDHQDVHT